MDQIIWVFCWLFWVYLLSLMNSIFIFILISNSFVLFWKADRTGGRVVVGDFDYNTSTAQLELELGLSWAKIKVVNIDE